MAESSGRSRAGLWFGLIGVVVVGIAAFGVSVVLRDESQAKDLRVLLIDKTAKNVLPADLRVTIVGYDEEWFPTVDNRRAELLIEGGVEPGSVVRVTALVPERVEVELSVAEQLEGDEVVALLSVSDDQVVLEIDHETIEAERRDPVAEAAEQAREEALRKRREAKQKRIADIKRVLKELSPLDALSDQAGDAYQAIFGEDNLASFDEIKNGIDDKVLPVVNLGLDIVGGVESEYKDIQGYIDLRYECWDKWSSALYAERNNAEERGDRQDAITALYAAYDEACNKSANARRDLEREAGIKR